jgi:hypothetical protein
MNISAQDAYKLIDEMTLGQQQWSSVRGPIRGAPSVIERTFQPNWQHKWRRYKRA